MAGLEKQKMLNSNISPHSSISPKSWKYETRAYAHPTYKRKNSQIKNFAPYIFKVLSEVSVKGMVSLKYIRPKLVDANWFHIFQLLQFRVVVFLRSLFARSKTDRKFNYWRANCRRAHRISSIQPEGSTVLYPWRTMLKLPKGLTQLCK
jgi:hypothetical protein